MIPSAMDPFTSHPAPMHPYAARPSAVRSSADATDPVHQPAEACASMTKEPQS